MGWSLIPVAVGDDVTQDQYDELYEGFMEKFEAIVLVDNPYWDFYETIEGLEEKGEDLHHDDLRLFQLWIYFSKMQAWDKTSGAARSFASIIALAGVGNGSHFTRIPARLSASPSYGYVAAGADICIEHINELRTILDCLDYFYHNPVDNTCFLYSRTFTSDWEESYSSARSSAFSGLSLQSWTEQTVGSPTYIGMTSSWQRREVEPDEGDPYYEYKCTVSEYRGLIALTLEKGADLEEAGIWIYITSMGFDAVKPLYIYQKTVKNALIGTLQLSTTSADWSSGAWNIKYFTGSLANYIEGTNYLLIMMPMENILPLSFDEGDSANSYLMRADFATGKRYFLQKIDLTSWEYKADEE